MTTNQSIKTRLMVGMEIHVELATRSKMFTAAPNIAHPDHYDAKPNTLTDPVVLGMPGVLPVINKQAVEMAMLVGLALGCRIASFTKWDRKSYYYPDLPKNYQISQYDLPLCGEGAIDIPVSEEPDAATKTIRIIRAHLEEDAGKLLHEAPGGLPIDYSIVDLNRSGTPLLEIVTYPDFETPQEVVSFANVLRNICRHLGVSEAVMQKGHIRFEPNINVIIETGGHEYRTPIVEIKNLNSFKAVFSAVKYEHRRQVDEWLETGRVAASGQKSTRGWDDVKQVTILQREKEEAHDYRYFPDPDLVPFIVSDEWIDQIKSRLAELPLTKHDRYVTKYNLSPKAADALIDDPKVCKFYEELIAVGIDPKRAANIVLNPLQKLANEKQTTIDELNIEPNAIAELDALIFDGTVSSTAANQAYGFLRGESRPVVEIIDEHGLRQVSDAVALEKFIDNVLKHPPNHAIVADIQAGKDKAIGALIGQVMKLSHGQANPKRVSEMIREKVSED